MKTCIKLVTTKLVLLLLSASSLEKEYFVSLDGDDSNPGTDEKPLKTVQKAITLLAPGDTCTIRGGQYTEEVTISGLKGTPEKPILFQSYPGEIVTFDGTTQIQSEWERYKNDIYVTTLDEDVWQLFVDGEMQINARWPNAFWYDYSVFDYTTWGFADANSTFDPSKGVGVIVDNGTQGLAKSNIDATGAVTILNIGSWLTWAGVVEKHAPGENSFSFDLKQEIKGSVKFHGQNSRYFLEDKLEFLDAPSEWFYDMNTKKLYLWMTNHDPPSHHDIRGKVSTYAFTISNSSSWIVLSNLYFFATTLLINGEDDTNDISNIRLESLHISYPSYSKRMLGSVAIPNMTTIYYNGLLSPQAGNFSVFNCTWEYADGQTMRYRGADGVFENCLWHHNDFSCVGNGALFSSEGVRDKFVRNTVHSNGPSVGFSPGSGTAKDRQLGLSIGADVRLNLFYDLKYLQDDGSHIQTHITVQNGTVLEYNWCFDTMKYGLRFDRAQTDKASWGYNGTVRSNVISRTRGLMIKGDNHHVENNLSFDNELPFDLALLGFPGKGAKGENIHTVTTGNILQHGACADYTTTEKCPYIPGNFTNNTQGDVRKLLRDPDNLDYRPAKKSDLFTKDIGPYGNESSKSGGIYWIPGRQQLTPSMPIPPNGTTTAKCDADLMWLLAYGAQSQYLFFSTNETAVSAGDRHVLMAILSGQYAASNIVTPTFQISPKTTYYWMVVSVNGEDAYMGDVWQFQCKV